MQDHVWLPVTSVLVVAAITPGPNNFMVMQASARGGAAAAGTVVLGIVLGSLGLLALVSLGVGSLIHACPRLSLVLSLIGGAYLGWLGASLIFRHAGTGASENRRGMPTSLCGVAMFQLFNPKAWMLIMTAVAALGGAGSVLRLAALIAVISSTCLSIWALAGTASSRWLSRPRAQLWFDRMMGALLALSAGGIIFDALA
jgi:threonine/homoserine/homoserine lactone efflux protein